MTTEAKLEYTTKVLTAISKELCDEPTFALDDAGKLVLKRCRDRGDSSGPFTGELLCPSCHAREALDRLKESK